MEQGKFGEVLLPFPVPPAFSLSPLLDSYFYLLLDYPFILFFFFLKIGEMYVCIFVGKI